MCVWGGGGGLCVAGVAWRNKCWCKILDSTLLLTGISMPFIPWHSTGSASWERVYGNPNPDFTVLLRPGFRYLAYKPLHVSSNIPTITNASIHCSRPSPITMYMPSIGGCCSIPGGCALTGPWAVFLYSTPWQTPEPWPPLCSGLDLEHWQ